MSVSHCNLCEAVLDSSTPRAIHGPASALQLSVLPDERRCPSCGSAAHERLLVLYLERTEVLRGRQGLRILHFNPEPALTAWLAQLEPELHVLASQTINDRRYVAIDIENIAFGDQSFDLVIANRTLEGVNSLERALQEVNRVLKVDGVALLQTSQSHLLEQTWEDGALNTEELRAQCYGHPHHRRLFGKDILRRLETHLSRFSLSYAQVLSEKLALQYGLDAREPFFLFRKKWEESASSTVSAGISDADDGSPVKVSILCLAYNHAAFIDKTLAGFVAQRTTFRFEVVVGEDCSKDGTLAILQIWSERYPGLIKVLSTHHNLGMHRNFLRTYQACSGKYIAVCEGDDRWTDPCKLQMQFDYLESHPECALTYGNVQAHSNGVIDYAYTGGAQQDFPSALLQCAPAINTLTAMFRNVLWPFPPELLSSGAGDMFMWTLLAQHGSGHYMPEILPSIYNIHAGGVHSQTGQVNQHRLRLKTFFAAFHYYARQGRADLAEYFLQGVARDAAYIGDQLSFEEARNILGGLPQEMQIACQPEFVLDITALRVIVDSVISGKKMEQLND